MNEEKSDMINPGQDTAIIYIQTSIKFSDFILACTWTSINFWKILKFTELDALVIS
jgi:hypothetical protein